MNSAERKEEKIKMQSYLKEKYGQDFRVADIEKVTLGFAAGTQFEGKGYDPANNQFIVIREGQHSYEDTYQKVLASKLLRTNYQPNVTNLAPNTLFFVTANPHQNLNVKTKLTDLDKSKLNAFFQIAILVNESYSRESYYSAIQQFIKKVADDGFQYFTVIIDFVPSNKQKTVEDYIDTGLEESIFSEAKKNGEKKNAYETIIMDRFKYDSSSYNTDIEVEDMGSFFINK
ncbi:hypothetical protein [Neobacillus dielmonensis]|uniref:hypothetical protein n=1 Tax=Neobacillus dielmonensis TaxID=1347369 RepID=UPI0012B592AF|nr:hypothetical protein [Neobacillus dielmonensis]